MKNINFSSLSVEVDNKVLVAKFNKPDTLNAIDDEVEDDLVKLLQHVTHDCDINVVVLTGEGRCFSAGGDIEHMQRSIDNPEAMHGAIPRAKLLISSFLDCPKPIIAKINGHAIGLGATLALICDAAIAVEDAKIGDPHVLMGFVAGDGGSAIWPQLVGYMKAKQYLLTGDTMSAIEAENLGLITKSVAQNMLDEEVSNLANRLASGPSKAIQWTKLSINVGLKQVMNSVIDASIAYEVLSNYTADHQEAVSAFREKRKPVFSGK